MPWGSEVGRWGSVCREVPRLGVCGQVGGSLQEERGRVGKWLGQQQGNVPCSQ